MGKPKMPENLTHTVAMRGGGLTLDVLLSVPMTCDGAIAGIEDPMVVAAECYRAIGGEGPRAYDWADKPHRLVYDLCKAIVGMKKP
jgi:hypothetical protein